MNFKEAVISYFKNWSNFTGRARRSEFWYARLFESLAIFILTAIDFLLFKNLVEKNVFPIVSVYSLITFIPSISLLIRRLHDTNRSGWFTLLFLIPFANFILMLIFLTEDSFKGKNKWGENPKAKKQENLETV